MSDNPISDALNKIPYGFYALTSRDGEDRNVMVMNWFTQVSFEPQHIAIGLQNTSYTYSLVSKSKRLVVNIFKKENAELVKTFSKSRKKDPEKFEGLNYSDGPVTGVPVVDEAAAYLECEVDQIVDTGAGHSVVIARVVGAGVREEGEAEESLTLLDIGWSYSG